MGILQSTAQYRLNYLWNTKIEIAKSINEVGKNKDIHVNPRDTFISFAEKILKLETSVWSSALDSQDPHLTITENGYYKVSDLSLRQFGDASKKTVVSSFYVNVAIKFAISFTVLIAYRENRPNITNHKSLKQFFMEL